MDHQNPQKYLKGISIQVCLNGYSFKVDGRSSGWLGADTVFTVPELQHRYGSVEISLLTPKVALVPSAFYCEASAGELLSETVALESGDAVAGIPVPEYSAVLVYSLSIGEMLSGAISAAVKDGDGNSVPVLPEMYYILKDLGRLSEHNRIVASFGGGYLHLGIAQGDNLLLANVFRAADFTTAEYFLFMTIRRLQMNPEVSSVHFRTPLSDEMEMSLYRYFRSVEKI